MNPSLDKIDFPPIETNNYPIPPGASTEAIPVLRGRDIVIVGLQPWYFPTGCNAKNIAQLLAENNRVLYVNFPIKRKAYFSKVGDPMIDKHVTILREKQEKLRKISSNLWEYYPGTLIESVNWLPSTIAFNAVNYFNNRKFAKDIRQAIGELGFKQIILFNDNEVYNGFYLKELLEPSLYIYYFRDFLQGYDYWKKHVSKLEPVLIGKADAVVANSLYYAEYGSGFNDHSYYIGQGCDFNYFDHTRSFAVPEDIQQLRSPIIGYIGALDSARLDLEIIYTIARANAEWNVVLVGPEDEVFRQSDLHQLPNVHFTGGKPFDLLPAYVRAFTVCINPQLKNQITKGNYPLKIDEYLAMGRPVIATRTMAMKIFEGHTYLADNPGEYPALIQKALSENNPEKENERIVFARSHTWENCMSELYKAISLATKAKKKGVA
ncbi:glycosyltransferase [Flavitalea flava]